MELIVDPAIEPLVLDAVTHQDRVIWGHGDESDVEQLVEIRPQEKAIVRVVESLI